MFGIPNERWGETPKAVVVIRPGASVSEAELIGHTRDRVGSVKKVGSVDFAETLPRTASGKVLRSELKAHFWRDRTDRIGGS